MKDKVLSFLRKQEGFISGEEISREFSISRAAIWKHINQLKKEGYKILAVPHLGYKLESGPDRLTPQEVSYQLDTKLLGKKIYYYAQTSSTMDEAMRLSLEGAPEGTLILAEAQTKGRGRLGRDWYSPKAKGIYLSTILRPKILPNETPKLTLMVAVACAQAINRITGLHVTIKWPNDLLIKERKLGGILTELNAEADSVKFVVIGIGINVNNPRSSLPAKATSLKEEINETVPRIELLKRILIEIERCYLVFQKEGFGPILEQWRQLSSMLGTRIRVNYKKEHIEGVAIDVDMDGSLLVRKDSGFIERVIAGDIARAR